MMAKEHHWKRKPPFVTRACRFGLAARLGALPADALRTALCAAVSKKARHKKSDARSRRFFSRETEQNAMTAKSSDVLVEPRASAFIKASHSQDAQEEEDRSSKTCPDVALAMPLPRNRARFPCLSAGPQGFIKHGHRSDLLRSPILSAADIGPPA